MRAAGVPGLTLVKGTPNSHLPGLAHMCEAESVERFGAMFPDQRQWVAALARYLGVGYIHQVMDELGYHHPAELFSMHLCILLVGRSAGQCSQEVRLYRPRGKAWPLQRTFETHHLLQRLTPWSPTKWPTSGHTGSPGAPDACTMRRSMV